ncbi:hypothetical protein FOCC_FOCC002577 [Frankliniella occidentalis]|nr:hypothetical protein FOCC_FOCC002577 [Frankliniella occidentalis]
MPHATPDRARLLQVGQVRPRRPARVLAQVFSCEQDAVMETDRLTQLQQVQVVPAQQVAATELAPFPKKCTISNLVKRPPVNIEFHDLKFTTHNAKGGCLSHAVGGRRDIF